MEIAGLLSTLPELIALIPTVLYVTQMMFYIFLIWFFGSFAMRGIRKHKTFVTGFFGKLLTGSLCLIGSMSFSGFVPFTDNLMAKLLQLDMLVSGMLVSLFFFLAFRLITHKDHIPGPREIIFKMERKVAKLEDMLRKGSKHLSEENAKHIAEKEMVGFKAGKARIVGNEWEIELKKDQVNGKVILDAWDGEIKKKISDESSFVSFFRDAHKIAGLAVIVIVLAASALFFEGFPDPSRQMASIFGVSMDDITNLSQSLKNMPGPFTGGEGCVGQLALARYSSQMQDQDFLQEHTYEDEQTARVFEQNAGERVVLMLSLDYDGKEVIVGLMESPRICTLTGGNFCGCIDGPN